MIYKKTDGFGTARFFIGELNEKEFCIALLHDDKYKGRL